MGSDFAPLHLGDGTFGLIARAKFYGTAFKEISRDIDLSASRGCSRAQVHRRTQDNGFDCHASIRVNGRDPIIAKAALARLSLRSQQIKINSGLVGDGDPQILGRPFFAIPPGPLAFISHGSRSASSVARSRRGTKATRRWRFAAVERLGLSARRP
jgi:hypothetical protein